MYVLYGYRESGNTYKVRLLFHQLGARLEFVHLDILKGETHTPEFAEKNPFEMTPVLESTRDGRVFAESNAILWQMARETVLGFKTAEDEYDALRWMFYEQNALEPNLGRARRLLYSEKRSREEAGPQLLERQGAGAKALELFDRAIGARRFLVRDAYSIADIALFGYVHVSPQAGVSLDDYPNINRWMDNVRSTTRFKELDDFS